MDPSGTPSNMLDSRAKTVWRVYASAAGVPAVIAIAVAVGILIAAGLWTMAWLAPILGALVLLGLWLGPFVEIAYRRWRWEVTDVEVRLQSGLIIVKRTVIPMARIQHVDTSQGPLLRFFGMSEVHVSTAAGKHKIPMLADEDAAGIRDRIAALAQVTDDGGL
jgi:membrane protein YdbS with pleckstrin-like domain